MATVPLIFPNQSNPGRFFANGSARLVNCFRENMGGEGTVTDPIQACSGFRLWSTLPGGGAIRAALPVDNYFITVSDRLLFRVDSAGAATQIGAIPTDGPVYMARNRANPTQVGIVSAGQLWVLVGTTLTLNTDVDLQAASSFDIFDGYGIFPGYGNTWGISDTDDLTTILPGDIASAESSPDALKRVAVREMEVVLFGADSTEWWVDTGDEFPFKRVNAKRIGCLSAASVTRFAQTLAWVATDADDNIFVAVMNGYDGQRISTHAVERAIRDDANRESITATSWGEDGHTFLAISGTDWTWVYDKATGLWHERASYGSNKWRCNLVVPFAGKLIACDGSEGKLYEMHRDYHNENGDPLIVKIVTPSHHAFPSQIRVNSLSLQAALGNGEVPGDDATSDPQLMIEFSKDGGASFTEKEDVSLGSAGDRRMRIRARKFGKAEDQGITFRFTVSAAVGRSFNAGILDVDKLGGG